MELDEELLFCDQVKLVKRIISVIKRGSLNAIGGRKKLMTAIAKNSLVGQNF